MKFRSIIVLVLVTVIYFSCQKSDTSETYSFDNYDRQVLLSNLVDNILIPAYQNFYSELNEFDIAISNFQSAATSNNLQDIRSKFIEAYKLWQHVEMFNIGYAEEIFYGSKMNIYPTNVSRISNNINSINSDLDTNPNQFSAQGFPAIDYMLYGIAGSDQEFIELYGENSGDNPTFDYLNLIVDRMVVNTDAVVNDWLENKDNFINSTGNTSGSSLNMLANDFIYYYEKGFRANKFGIPAGVWAGILTQNVESFYARSLSKVLAQESLNASKNFFLGIHYDSDINGEGLYDYIAYLDDTNYSNNSDFIGLQDAIVESMDNSMNKINSLSDNFVNQIENDNYKMLETFDAIQDGVVLMKTNMLSLLGISVDYFDADGD